MTYSNCSEMRNAGKRIETRISRSRPECAIAFKEYEKDRYALDKLRRVSQVTIEPLPRVSLSLRPGIRERRGFETTRRDDT